ncbi:hypothetical protein [Spongiactinospora sp. TRM90649]|uniref:hypothetical protein n=1 Tax=Spongiactinospora sp. TRM90649 TaxID=3031114 RepID=UPI0023F97815|nr:hypothetical protein [Spongiactinospora sp. TRM90649]MDF5758479.1 hypothetical protein [Spongiactinospora sp. TRM90649]
MDTDGRIQRAGLLYQRAIFNGDQNALTDADRELDAVEADLALARGRVLHGRFLEERRENPHELPLFERAADLYRTLGDKRGEGEALFWIACFHQLVRGDDATAGPLFERADEIATQAADDDTRSEVLRHQGIAAHKAGHLDKARDHLEESTRLRRESGHLPGVAANQVGLIYIAIAQGRHEDARTLADEARTIAHTTDSTRLLHQIEEATTNL